jgi:2,5-diketo-D-gluconate reductase A
VRGVGVVARDDVADGDASGRPSEPSSDAAQPDSTADTVSVATARAAGVVVRIIGSPYAGILRPPVVLSGAMTVPNLTLNDGTSIPQFGFGVFQVPPAETAAAVAAALAAGYRHIDTAQMYGNEEGVGTALAATDVPREELYVTTKLNNSFHRPDDVRRSFDESFARLGLDYVDLFLIHWPLPTRYDGDYVSTWQAMAELREDGRLRSVGVSNFQPDHLDRIVAETGVVPAVNQIEVHPFFGNEAARAASLRHGALVEGWSPIAQGKVLDDPTVRQVAEQVGRTPSQVTLRWHIQRGDIVFPKSMRPERMAENLAVFDFELDDAQMAALTGLDEGDAGRIGPDPDTFDWIPD